MSTDDTTDQHAAPAAVGLRLDGGVGRLQPERFCIGVSGREQCDDCEGRYVPAPGWSVPPRILVHQPWPFEPCPHYVAPV